jgi:hypothetical protein
LLRNWTTEVQKRTVWRCRRAARRASHIWTIGDVSQDWSSGSGGTRARRWSRAGRRPGRTPGSAAGPGRAAQGRLELAAHRPQGAADPAARDRPSGAGRPGRGDGARRRPARQVVAALARRLGVTDRVRFAGMMPLADALKVVSTADVMAFTSVQDGTPQAVLEAMSLGLPVICHDACGMGAAVTSACGVKVPLVDPRRASPGSPTPCGGWRRSRTCSAACRPGPSSGPGNWTGPTWPPGWPGCTTGWPAGGRDGGVRACRRRPGRAGRRGLIRRAGGAA